MLGPSFGLFSNEPLLRISSLGCCSYTIGGLGRVNLLDLQRKLLGATLSVAEDIFPETLWPAASPISDPRHIFSLINGRSDSPTLRVNIKLLKFYFKDSTHIIFNVLDYIF